MALDLRLLRLHRSAKSIAGGDEILKFLLSNINKRRLIEAAKEGRPPVTAVSSPLLVLALENKIDIKALPVRQFIGAVVKFILDKEGFVLLEKGIRTPKDPIFTTASIYAEKKRQVPESLALLQKILECLSDEEANFAFEELKLRLNKK